MFDFELSHRRRFVWGDLLTCCRALRGCQQQQRPTLNNIEAAGIEPAMAFLRKCAEPAIAFLRKCASEWHARATASLKGRWDQQWN
eukprot:11198967-Alexandrium_andersonii.AAC.1